MLVAARNENPLVVGVSADGEAVMASDVTPLLDFTHEFTFLEDGDLVVLREGEFQLMDLDGEPVERPVHVVDWNLEDAQKGGFEHFMLK